MSECSFIIIIRFGFLSTGMGVQLSAHTVGHCEHSAIAHGRHSEEWGDHIGAHLQDAVHGEPVEPWIRAFRETPLPVKHFVES